MVEKNNEENNSNSSEGEGRTEGRGPSRTKEYVSLIVKYKAMSQVYVETIDQINETIGSGREIDEAHLSSLMKMKAALNVAEKIISVHLATVSHDKELQHQNLELSAQEKKITELNEEKESKEKELEKKAKDLGKTDMLSEFFLPGDLLTLHEERKISDVKELVKEVTKLEKTIKSEESKISPIEQKKLKVVSKNPSKASSKIKETAVSKLKKEEKKQDERQKEKKDLKVPMEIRNISKKLTRNPDKITSKAAPLKPHDTPVDKELEKQKKLKTESIPIRKKT